LIVAILSQIAGESRQKMCGRVCRQGDQWSKPCRSSHRASDEVRANPSTSRPPRRSARRCRPCCSPAPTRGSSESARIHHLAGLLCHRGPDYCSGAGAGQDQAHPCALAHQL